MARLVRRKCPCLRPKIEEEVRVLDYRHSSLTDVPSEVFNFERTLEELHADSNQIRDLPRELFYCHGLSKLSISDNEITNIPPAIASLDHLEELDFSKNGIIDVPDNVKCCKYLRIVDASVNPLGKLPEGFTQLQNLTHLYLNDTFLDYLPGSFGRLVKLKILEMRENHLKTLPKSFGRLTELERLDIGNNEFTELPDVVGSLSKLLELWCDHNQITSLTHAIGGLKQLIFLDASKNELVSMPGEIEGCSSLADLHLTTNQLRSLPEAIGHLNSLTTLKVDDNQLISLPSTLGGLTSLSELNVSANDLEDLPASIGLLRNLRTFYADENLLTFVPAELGSCNGITVLSLRSNRLTYIPDEIGRIPRLRVLNLSDNQLSYLPFTIVKLKELQALWLTENQTRPLIPLQSDYEPETGRKILTCYLLPQGHNSDNDDDNGGDGDSDSFHASIWDEERLQRQQIHFSFGDDEDDEGHLVRCPTPYPKDMREKARHMRNLALRQSTGDSTQPPSRSPQSQHSHGARQEGKSSYAGSEEGAMMAERVGVGEARACKPQSPSLQETHRLYCYDKEKLMRDKARMHHRHSMPSDVAIFTAFSPVRRGDSTSGASDTDDGRVAGRRKSTPNLLSFEGQSSDGKLPKRMPSFTYEDLYQKQILRKHHHHHGRRSRRMREYDSDTGYRSDREVSFMKRNKDDTDYQSDREASFQRQRDIKDDLSVRSQPTMSRSHHRRGGGQGREGGYTSDLEAYAGRGRGLGRGPSSKGSSRRNTAPAPSPMPRQSQPSPMPRQSQPSPMPRQSQPSPMPRQSQQSPSSSLSQDLGAHSSAAGAGGTGGQDPSSGQPRPQSCLTVPGSSRPSSGSHQQRGAGAGPPSPCQFSDNSAGLDDSMAVASQAPQELSSSGSSVFAQPAADFRERTLQADLHTMLEEHNRKMAAHRPSLTPSPSGSRGTVRQTPPPYQPAPPYRRPSDRVSEQSDSSGIPRSPQDSDLANSSFSNPEYTAVAQYSKESSDAVQAYHHHHDRKHEGLAVVHDRADVEQSAGASQQHRTSGQQGVVGEGVQVQAQTNSQSYDYGRGGKTRYDSPSDGRSNNTEGAQTVYAYGRAGRTRYDSPSGGHPSANSSTEGSQTSQSYDHGRGGRTRYDGSSGVDQVPHSDSRPSGLDYSVSSYATPRRASSSQYTTPAAFHSSSRRSSAPYPDRSRDNLTPVMAQNPHLDGSSRHSPHYYGTPPSARPRSGSRDDGLGGQCDTRVMRSPKPLDSGASSSPKPCPSSVQKTFEECSNSSQQRYPSSSPQMFEDCSRSSQRYPSSSQKALEGRASSFAKPYPSSSPKPYPSSSSQKPFQACPPSSSQKAFESYPPSSSHRAFEAYPNPYGEPLEVGDPLMNRYEDVAVFKSVLEQDPYQVSSSTDSGYVHGHQIYERLGGDLSASARRSGSPYSSTPSHRGTPVRQNSSSQGTPSRETTPVREDAVFYSLQPGSGNLDEFSAQESRDVFRTVIHKNPGLGFSIAGGSGWQSQNPFRPGDSGIFVTKVQAEGPAASFIQPGDKLLQVNHVDFSNIDHTTAVNVLKTSTSVDLLVERVQKINLV